MNEFLEARADSTPKLLKVSNNKVIPSKEIITNEKKVKAADWFPINYPNMYLLAMKRSGKTTTIGNILDRKAGKYTNFIFISSTINKDPEWLKITKKFEDKGNMVMCETSPVTEDGEDVLASFMEDNKEDKESNPPEQQKEIIQTIGRKNGRKVIIESKTITIKPDPVELTDKQKIAKSKEVYPEWIIVLDDLSGEMKKLVSLEKLLKTNRHYHAMVIISSQNLNDLNPAQILQLDYALLFGRIPENKLEEVHKKLSIFLPIDKFLQLYYDATKEKYNFLYINRDNEFRKGFTHKYDV